MNDRPYVEKAAAAGAGKLKLLQDDPLRYMVRSIGAGMGLTLVVFVFWVLKQNLHDIPLGPVIASGFFGVGLTIIVFTNTELFTSNNMYLTVSSAEGRTSWRQAITALDLLLFREFSWCDPDYGAACRRRFPRRIAPRSCIVQWSRAQGPAIMERNIFQRDTSELDRLSSCTSRAPVQGGSCQNPSPDPHRFHLRISWLRTFHREYGYFLNGVCRGQQPDSRRRTPQSALQHDRQCGWWSAACRATLYLSESART